MGARDPGGEKRGDLARPLFLAVFSKGKEERFLSRRSVLKTRRLDASNVDR